MITSYITAGALIRRQVRTQLLSAGIPFAENKGIFESDFVITASKETWRTLHRWITEQDG